MIEFQYRASTAIGVPLEGEPVVDYVRRTGYEIDRLEAILERHITWYTHKNPNAGECPICAIFIVARGVHRVFESMLGPDVPATEDPRGQDGTLNIAESGT